MRCEIERILNALSEAHRNRARRERLVFDPYVERLRLASERECRARRDLLEVTREDVSVG